MDLLLRHDPLAADLPESAQPLSASAIPRASKRPRCARCPGRLDRKISVFCSKCKVPVCKEHSVVVCSRSRSPTWPYYMQQPYGSRAGAKRVGFSDNYFGADLNNSNSTTVFVTFWSNMAPVWELCADSAYLNDPVVQYDEQDLLIEPTRSRSNKNCHKRRTHQQKRPQDKKMLTWSSCNFEAAFDKNQLIGHNRGREGSQKVVNPKIQTQNYKVSSTKRKSTNVADELLANTDNRGVSNRNSRHNNRKLKEEDVNTRTTNAKYQLSHQKYHQHHYHKNKRSFDHQNRNRNGRHPHSHPTGLNNNSSEDPKEHRDCDVSTVRLRRRRSHHRGEHKRRAVTWSDADGKPGHDKTSNKRENRQMDLTDISNNWLFGLFSKSKEDPRKAEERFYGGLGYDQTTVLKRYTTLPVYM
ncbi:hypothetical protein ElyMa_006781900 [Elysia marginata]|uniref:PiggyBac transposable element-derived protein domain-containing protein n=1 Tax=Elysia marginata TaxID=1093978 RepID=A0AAV4J1T2_9GAST|nr:hypothetical protein ElyMa_006781900 [Elysia marginata]